MADQHPNPYKHLLPHEHGELVPATLEDLAQTIRYALRFGDRGKPLTSGYHADPKLMAAWVARHILRSNFVIYRRHREPGPRPGRCGAPPGGTDRTPT